MWGCTWGASGMRFHNVCPLISLSLLVVCMQAVVLKQHSLTTLVSFTVQCLSQSVVFSRYLLRRVCLSLSRSLFSMLKNPALFLCFCLCFQSVVCIGSIAPAPVLTLTSQFPGKQHRPSPPQSVGESVGLCAFPVLFQSLSVSRHLCVRSTPHGRRRAVSLCFHRLFSTSPPSRVLCVSRCTAAICFALIAPLSFYSFFCLFGIRLRPISVSASVSSCFVCGVALCCVQPVSIRQFVYCPPCCCRSLS